MEKGSFRATVVEIAIEEAEIVQTKFSTSLLGANGRS